MKSRGYSWGDLSRSAYTLASWRAAGSPNWNRAFQNELAKMGFQLLPVADDVELGEDGPMYAPVPQDDHDQYLYPCIIVPVGWDLRHL